MKTRTYLKNKKRILIKIGSSSLIYPTTGELNLTKLDKLVRVISDISNQGKDVVLVSSGAIAVGSKAVGVSNNNLTVAQKQACASIGQAMLMMVYQKLFKEYSKTAAQVLLTKDIMECTTRKNNAINTFKELLKLKVIPIVNENDTVATEEIEFGDNDTLSAIVANLIDADLLILMSDIDGLYEDDPRVNLNAKFIEEVDSIDKKLENMAKGAGTSVGTGGMVTKIQAAKIATQSGTDMVITNADDLDNIVKILDGENVGTLFIGEK